MKHNAVSKQLSALPVHRAGQWTSPCAATTQMPSHAQDLQDTMQADTAAQGDV